MSSSLTCVYEKASMTKNLDAVIEKPDKFDYKQLNNVSIVNLKIPP